MKRLHEAADIDVLTPPEGPGYLQLHGARCGISDTFYRMDRGTAQDLLRHQSLETTKDHYSHIDATERRSRNDPNEPLTAPEIADQLGCSRTTALNRLRELADRGDVVSKKVGGRSRVWWLPSTESDDRDLLKGYGSWTGTALAAAVEETREQLDEDL